MFKDLLLNITKRLYPKGRAFRIPTGSLLEKMHKGLIVSENLSLESAISVLDSILPDNANFTTDDATDWERRLGLISNPLTILADRKAAILRKMNHPGTIPARQHWLYLESQLQLANFNVYVYENRFLSGGNWITKTPAEFTSSAIAGQAVHMFDSSYLEHGQVQHGGHFNKIIANSIEASIDASFNIGNNYKSTFFLGGPTAGSFVNLEISREQEFRQLVLKIKPAQSVAFIFINFINFNVFDNTFDNSFN